MTRQSVKLEVLVRDLESRYGENDDLVKSVRSCIPQDPPTRAACHLPERRVRVQGPTARKKTPDLHAS